MKYCKKCLTTNLRPGGEFINGYCIPCFYVNNEKVSFPKTKLNLLKDLYKKIGNVKKTKVPMTV